MTAAPEQPGDPKHGRLESLALWSGLAVAFSPTLLELGRHMLEHPWARYAALFPFLFARAARARRGPPAPRGDGMLWIGSGMGMELLGILTGIPPLGRAGLVLAAVGLCRRLGVAGWRELLLLALVVPLPSVAFDWTSPLIESSLASVASSGLGMLGVDGIEVSRGAVRHGSQELVLERFDAGTALVPLLAGISWYGSLLLDVPTERALPRAVFSVLFAFPAQLIALALALLSLPLGSASAGRWALSELPWMVVAAVSLTLIEWRLRRGGPRLEV